MSINAGCFKNSFVCVYLQIKTIWGTPTLLLAAEYFWFSQRYTHYLDWSWKQMFLKKATVGRKKLCKNEYSRLPHWNTQIWLGQQSER